MVHSEYIVILMVTTCPLYSGRSGGAWQMTRHLSSDEFKCEGSTLYRGQSKASPGDSDKLECEWDTLYGVGVSRKCFVTLLNVSESTFIGVGGANNSAY